jgi:hypothetical protein
LVWSAFHGHSTRSCDVNGSYFAKLEKQKTIQPSFALHLHCSTDFPLHFKIFSNRPPSPSPPTAHILSPSPPPPRPIHVSLQSPEYALPITLAYDLPIHFLVLPSSFPILYCPPQCCLLPLSYSLLHVLLLRTMTCTTFLSKLCNHAQEKVKVTYL